jgi:hypothetical protein
VTRMGGKYVCGIVCTGEFSVQATLLDGEGGIGVRGRGVVNSSRHDTE